MTTSSSTYNCVYYWIGGTEQGAWRQADAGTRDKCRRMGYVAHNGHTNVGAPEGAPSKEELDAVLGKRGFRI